MPVTGCRWIIILTLLLWIGPVHGSEVTFVITADLHGKLTDMARLAPVIAGYPEAVKVDLGDFAQGNYEVIRHHALPVIDLFNHLGYDLLIPGNHDLEHPPEILHQWQKVFKGKILTGQWKLGNFATGAYTVIERRNYRIGVIALGETGLKKRLRFWPELLFQDEVETVLRSLRELRHKCDAIVLFCHISPSNYPAISRILKAAPEIDAVAGAHSHRELPGGIIRNVLTVQPGSHGQSAVVMKLNFDRHRKKLKYIRSFIVRAGERSDPAVEALCRRWQNKVSSGEIPGKINFSSAGEFGEFAAGVIRQKAGTQMAIVAFDPQKFDGTVDSRKLFDLFPYGNRIATVEVDQKTVKKLLRRRKRSEKFFVSGTLTGQKVTLAVSDYLLLREKILQEFPGRISSLFERQVISEALKERKSGRK